MREVIYRSRDEQISLQVLALKQPNTHCYMQASLLFFHYALQDVGVEATMSEIELEQLFRTYFKSIPRSRVWHCVDDVIYPPDQCLTECTTPALLVGETDETLTFDVEGERVTLPIDGFRPYGYVYIFVYHLRKHFQTKYPKLNEYTVEYTGDTYCLAFEPGHVIFGKKEDDRVVLYDVVSHKIKKKNVTEDQNIKYLELKKKNP